MPGCWGRSHQTHITSSGGGSTPRSPSLRRLSYISLLNISHFKRFLFLTFGLNPLRLAKFWLSAKRGSVPNQASDLPFYDIFAPQKIPFSKILDNVIACDLWFAPSPPNQESWLCLCCSHRVIRLLKTFLLLYLDLKFVTS